MREADAELARSILSCPESAELAVDGHPEVAYDADLGLRDDGGEPTFSRPARTVEELGVLLRHELHAGIC